MGRQPDQAFCHVTGGGRLVCVTNTLLQWPVAQANSKILSV
jgi:hypothetical protein